MNAFLSRIFVVLFVLFTQVGFAVESAVKVAASKELRLAVVDSSKGNAARDASHAAFAASLSQTVSRESGEIGVRVKCVPADQAAFNLNNGVYDAVLVLTGSLPRALMISDLSRLSATLGAGKSERKVYLVFNNNDATLAGLLATSFPLALTDITFLDAVDGISNRIAAAGDGPKVAVTP